MRLRVLNSGNALQCNLIGEIVEQSPYKPPQTDVLNPGRPDPYPRSVWWKVYFFFIVSMSAFSFYFIISDPVAGLVEYFLFTLWLFANTGLFGFVFCRPILGPKFWLIILFADIAFSLLYYYVANIDLRMDLTDSQYRMNNVISWLLSAPAYLGLYLYSRPTDRAWRGTADYESDNYESDNP